MSSDGGEGGGSSFSSDSSGKGGGGSTGALGKGGGGSDSGMGYSAPVDVGGGVSSYAPVTDVSTSPGEQAGFQGLGLPSEVTTGSSNGGGFDWGGMDWSTPSISANDLNLDGSGPVGGGSGLPGGGGGVSTFGGSGVVGAPDSANAIPFLDTGANTGTGVSAFAAPSGVAGGSPDLSDLTRAPTDAGASSSSGSSTLDSLKTGWAGNTPSGGSSSSSGDKGIMDTLGIKPSAGTTLAGAGLLNSLIQGNKPPAGTDAMSAVAANATNIAGQQNEAGKALQQFIATGTLPAGYEAQVQANVNAAKARIISNYASRGMPTDPSRNSTLAQELNQVDGQVPAMREQLAKTLADAGTSMVNAGLQATGISSNVFQNLAKMAQDQQNNRATAIANFAAALNGGTKGNSFNLKLA